MSGQDRAAIAVGFDGTPQSEDALALASLLADGRARLIVICIYRFRMLHGLESGEGAQAAVARAVALAGAGCRTQTRVRPARSVEEGLAAIVAEEQPDLLVLGAPRRWPRRRAVLQRRLARRVVTPIALAPRGFRARAGKLVGRAGAITKS